MNDDRRTVVIEKVDFVNIALADLARMGETHRVAQYDRTARRYTDEVSGLEDMEMIVTLTLRPKGVDTFVVSTGEDATSKPTIEQMAIAKMARETEGLTLGDIDETFNLKPAEDENGNVIVKTEDELKTEIAKIDEQIKVKRTPGWKAGARSFFGGTALDSVSDLETKKAELQNKLRETQAYSNMTMRDVLEGSAAAPTEPETQLTEREQMEADYNEAVMESKAGNLSPIEEAKNKRVIEYLKAKLGL